MALALEGGIGEDAVPRLNAWERRIIIVWGDEINDKKNKKYIMSWP
jgi:3-keto-L-gulonate-6-phosphate decarboxylase